MCVCACFSFLHVAVLGKNQIENMSARFIKFAIVCFCIKRVRQVHVSMGEMNGSCLYRLLFEFDFLYEFFNTMVRYEPFSL